MTKFTLLTLRVPAGKAEMLVEEAFDANGFSVTWDDPWTGRAQKVDDRGRIRLSPDSHVVLDFSISSREDSYVLRLSPSRGVVAGGTTYGGLWMGLHFAKGMKLSRYKMAVDALEDWFHRRDVLESIKRM